MQNISSVYYPAQYNAIKTNATEIQIIAFGTLLTSPGTNRGKDRIRALLCQYLKDYSESANVKCMQSMLILFRLPVLININELQHRSHQ